MPDAAAGKRTTCRKFGAAIRIPVATAPVEPARAVPAPAEPGAGLDSLELLARGEAVDVPRSAPAEPGLTGPMLAPDGNLPRAVGYAASPPGEEPRGAAPYFHYLAAVGKSLGFLRKPDSLLTFVIVWLLLALRSGLDTSAALAPSFMAGGFLHMASFAIAGWYMAFRMNLVVWAAGEQEDLPSLQMEDGWWDDIVVPFFRMLATYLAAFLPAGLFLVMLSMRMSAVATANAGLLVAGANPTPNSATVAVLVLLAMAGLFVWPLLVLAVSCGGSVRAMFQLDLLGETIVKSIGAYLLVVLAVWFTFGAQIGISTYVAARLAETTNWRSDIGGLFVLPALLAGVTLYFDIVAMQAIGYYYAHFKHKFAWSWG